MARLQRSLLVVLTALLVWPGPRAHACYASPTTLWTLVEKAERIVLARVERIEITSEPGEFEGETFEDVHEIAHMAVQEVWKGTSTDGLRVIDSGLEEGDVVLAFLVSGETVIATEESELRLAEAEEAAAADDAEEVASEGQVYAQVVLREAGEIERERQRRIAFVSGKWLPVGDAFGVLFPREEDLSVFRERIDAALELQKLGEVPAADRREWLLGTAERRATRFHGVYELSREERDDGRYLSEEEKARLAEAFWSEPSAGEGLSHTLDLLKGYEDARFDSAVVSAVEWILRNEPRPGASVEIQTAAARFADLGKLFAAAILAAGRGQPATGDREIWEFARRTGLLPMAPRVELPVEVEPGERPRGAGERIGEPVDPRL